MDRWVNIYNLEEQAVDQKQKAWYHSKGTQVDYKQTFSMMQLSNQWISHWRY
jgi:hypothetical protein